MVFGLFISISHLGHMTVFLPAAGRFWPGPGAKFYAPRSLFRFSTDQDEGHLSAAAGPGQPGSRVLSDVYPFQGCPGSSRGKMIKGRCSNQLLAMPRLAGGKLHTPVSRARHSSSTAARVALQMAPYYFNRSVCVVWERTQRARTSSHRHLPAAPAAPSGSTRAAATRGRSMPGWCSPGPPLNQCVGFVCVSS